MSVAVSVIDSPMEISNNIISWFNANDINQSIGSAVAALSGRQGKDNAVVSGGGSYVLAIDAQGYKCIRTSSINGWFVSPNSFLATNSETFICVMNIKGDCVSGTAFNDGLSMALGITSFSYSSYTVGVGRVVQPLIQNKKIIMTGVMTPTAMYLYNGFVLVATLVSPATLTSVSRVANFFRNDANTSNIEIDYYSVVRIQEALTGDKLRQAIRSIAFENGVNI